MCVCVYVCVCVCVCVSECRKEQTSFPSILDINIFFKKEQTSFPSILDIDIFYKKEQTSFPSILDIDIFYKKETFIHLFIQLFIFYFSAVWYSLFINQRKYEIYFNYIRIYI